MAVLVTVLYQAPISCASSSLMLLIFVLPF